MLERGEAENSGTEILNLEKAVIHEKHEIHEQKQKYIQLHGVTCLVNYCFAVMV